ncbi:heparan-sulfate 6-O-sulfotransferase 2 [Tetranychus urticae]|uniref:Heparan-sulfate 6-O-sulfotransferase n=1 Tax=Tetranychus urticae TaxID=32264 RepID=T1K5V7_TETUR|nr:heparan-sulfate 6-O-sulfotransferase 2 [Tetranychus urticae]
MASSLSMVRAAAIVCFLLFIISLLIIGYLCPDNVCSLTNWSFSESRYKLWTRYSLRHIPNHIGKSLMYMESKGNEFESIESIRSMRTTHRIVNPSKKLNTMSFDQIVKDPNFMFDIKGDDVMVFLHMQKTGGTSFGRHLVRDLDLEAPCQCKKGKKICKCIRPNSSSRLWLFSRYTTGWKCGLHADWTELVNCVDSVMNQSERTKVSDRHYFFITLLREPVSRFLSEFRHIQRGATWKNSLHLCGGRPPAPEEIQPCYTGDDWSNVSLQEFISCPYNLAINRQTRMLADLTLVGCYNHSIMSEHQRNTILLASAKENLKRMAFFGLCEQQKVSQYLFESTFKLYFLQPFIQLNETHSSLAQDELDKSMLDKIKWLNHLDIELYQYAQKLLNERLNLMKAADPNFNYNFNHLGLSKKSEAMVNRSQFISDDPDELSPEMRLIRKVEQLKKKRLSDKKAQQTLLMQHSP